jgi:hypothetical protein
MKKKLEKREVEKLKIHRETLRALTEDSLRAVEGAANTQNRSCILSCPTFC